MIGSKVVSHGRYVTFQMAEVAVLRQMFLSLIARRRAPPAPRVTGKSDQMRQTVEVRLDHENAAGSGVTGEQSGGLAPNQVDRDRISLRREPPGTEDKVQRAGNPGSVGWTRGRAMARFGSPGAPR